MPPETNLRDLTPAQILAQSANLTKLYGARLEEKNGYYIIYLPDRTKHALGGLVSLGEMFAIAEKGLQRRVDKERAEYAKPPTPIIPQSLLARPSH